jgi:beta-glucosidase
MDLYKYSISFMLITFLVISKLHSQSLNNRIDSLMKLMSTQDKIDQLINNSFLTTPDNTALGIPGFKMDDGPHGVRFQKATSFPVGVAVAATWNVLMAEKVGKAMGEEFWSFGYNQQLGPCIDLCLDPRAGRAAETGGEDPFLAGQIGAAVTKGIQTTPVMATVKHFMVESKQNTRQTANEVFTERGMMEHYGYNFRTTMQEGACFSIMNAFNLINGKHCSENSKLQDTTLRQRWGYPFFTVSDWEALYNAKNGILGGTDLNMGSDHYKNDLPGLISSGQVPMAVLNKAVANILRTKILSGIMDYYPKGDKALANSAEHVKIALDASRESMVLLKNTNKILPLNKSTVTKIALIGPNANAENLNCWGSSETTPPYAISVKEGIEAKIGNSKVVYTMGCAINSTDTSGFKAARAAAAQADYVVFVGGLDQTQEGEGYDIGGDRKSGKVELPGMQQNLINSLASVNKNIIVVIHSGGVCAINNCINNMKGLIYSFYPGQEAGNAVADVLFGDYNPGGKMPVSMPKATNQLPVWDDDFTNDYGCGYRWFDEKSLTPEFAFGSGMSYTTFEYSNLHISSSSAPAGSPIHVSLDVKNTGSVL